MYRISNQKLSTRPIPYGTTSTLPRSYYPWRIEIRHPSGGLIKNAFIGARDFNINEFSFTLTERGCENATLKMSNMDFPIYYGSELSIYKNNDRMYRGYISNIPSGEKESIKATPYLQRLSEISINTTYSNYTGRQILQDIIDATSTDTNVFWNNSIVNYNDTSIFESVSYKYEKVKKIIEDLYQNEDDAYYGVDANGFFYIKKRETQITKNLFNGIGQIYREIKQSKDYGKIKETQFDVFQKSTVTNENVFIATIPDGSSNYPYIDNQLIVGVKRDKLIAPSGLNSTECKDYAYAKLREQNAPENIKITGIDIDRLDLRIGQKISIQDKEMFQIFSIIDCDSTNGWNGNISLSSDNIEGNYSISFDTNNVVYYDFGEIQRYKKIKKIMFMVKSDESGSYLNFSYGQKLNGYSRNAYSNSTYSFNNSTGVMLFSRQTMNNISIRNPNVWNLIEIPITCDFRYIGFGINSTRYRDINIKIDDIQLFGLYKKIYTGNVIKLDYKINKKNQTLYDAEIGDYEPALNDDYFRWKKKIASLEETNQG